MCSSQRREWHTEMEESGKLHKEKKNISIKLHPHTKCTQTEIISSYISLICSIFSEEPNSHLHSTVMTIHWCLTPTHPPTDLQLIRVLLGLFQRALCPLVPLMCPLGLPQNQHIFNSHLNYLDSFLTTFKMTGVVMRY